MGQVDDQNWVWWVQLGTRSWCGGSSGQRTWSSGSGGSPDLGPVGLVGHWTWVWLMAGPLSGVCSK